jgi:hypothetical protein
MGALSTLNCPGFWDSGKVASEKRYEFLNDKDWVVSRGEEIAVAETRARFYRLPLFTGSFWLEPVCQYWLKPI